MLYYTIPVPFQELDTQDDAAVHVALVKSEGARKRFLADRIIEYIMLHNILEIL